MLRSVYLYLFTPSIFSVDNHERDGRDGMQGKREFIGFIQMGARLARLAPNIRFIFMTKREEIIKDIGQKSLTVNGTVS
jgi:hypothetical protein